MSKVGIIAALEVTPQGIACPEGWVQVSRAEGNARTIQFDANFYASEQAFDQDALPLLTRSFTLPYQSGDLVTILHSHLLTLTLDDADNPNPYSRLRCDLSAGTLVTREDAPAATTAETSETTEPTHETPNTDTNGTEPSSDGTSQGENGTEETPDASPEAGNSDEQTDG